MCMRVVSIGLDRPSKPPDRLLPLAGVILRVARSMHRPRNPRVTRTEAQAFQNMSLCFFGPPGVSFTQSDSGMGVGEISIKHQRMFTSGYPLRHALSQYFDIP